MKRPDGVLIFFILVLAILAYLASYSSPQNQGGMGEITYFETDLDNELSYTFMTNGAGKYEVVAIGNIRSVKDIGHKGRPDNLVSIAKALVASGDDLITETSDALYFMPSKEPRRLKVISFSANAEIEYHVALRLDGIGADSFRESIEIAIIPDPHEYKDGLISGMLLKVMSYILLFTAIILFVGRFFLVKAK